MKKLFTSVAFILLATVAFSQNLYSIDSITRIELFFFDPAWDDSLDYYMANNLDRRMLATCYINGQQFDSVGIKYKGNSSYNPANVKNPLNIKLDYIRNQDYEGYQTLKLSNVWRDPSFVREAMAYEIARNYTTASEANFAYVHIDGSLMGLYTSVEDVNDQFTNKHYASEDLPLMKGEQVQGPPAANCPQTPPRVWGYEGIDSSCYSRYYEIESAYGWNAIELFCDTFNNFPASMENVLYVDRHLWSLAFDILLVNLDAPVNIPHNFYLYKDHTDRFNHILWDLNLCFGSFSKLLVNQSQVQLSTTQLQQLDIFLNETSPNYPIIGNIMSDSRYRKMYIAHMRTIFDEQLTSGLYLTRVQYLQSLIDTCVQNDPNKFFTYTDFQTNMTGTVQGIIGISQLVNGRMSYLNSLPEFQYTQPVISSVTHSPAAVTLNSTVTITANIANANYAYLGYRYRTLDKFQKIQMEDDGLHNDGSAGDGIYGASIPSGASFIQYYIYSENNDAGRFSPARAEYEFYSIEVEKDVVINEFMALNGSSWSDQNGEADDWIELHNNTSSTVSLKGYYLSDDANNLSKWAFPDTSIAPAGYLIIWADNDTLQAGLHANFKLSATGESLFLTDSLLDIRDEVIFGQQTTDITTGRYPNGTGAFFPMTPTFSWENTWPLSTEEVSLPPADARIYPNPATSTVTIETGSDEELQVNVYNLMGQIMYSSPVRAYHSINVAHWPKGIYIVNAGGVSKKLVVQ